MNWFILAAFAGIASNVFNIYNRSSLKEKGDSSTYAWWFELFRFIIFFIIFAFTPIFPKEPIAYFWLLLLGLTEVGSVYLFMKSHQLTQLSLSTFVIKLQLIWTPILAFLFIQEKLSLTNYGGITVILAGIFIAIYSKGIKKDRGVLITFFSSILISVVGILMKKTVVSSSTPLIMLSMSAPSVFLLPLLMKQAKKRIFTITSKKLINNFAGVIANVVAMYLFLSALRLEAASKVGTVYQSMMIVSLIYGVVFLRERKNIGQKLVGTAVIIFGLIILAMV